MQQRLRSARARRATPRQRAEQRQRQKTRHAARAGGLVALAAAGIAAAAHNLTRTRRAEAEHPPRGRFLTVDGVRLHVVEDGVGAPVVLLHGNAVTLEDWRDSGVLSRLARDHRVIALDRPGYGHSSRPRDRLFTPAVQARLFLDALERLRVHRPVVVGHSFGALVALEMAAERPDALAGVVLAGGYYFATARLDSAMALPSALPLVGDLNNLTAQPFIARAAFPLLTRAIFHPANAPAGFTRPNRALGSRPGQLRAQAEDGVLMIPAAAALAERLNAVRVPAILITGESDRIVDPARQTRRLAEYLTAAEVRVVPGAGHMVHYADPDGVARAAAELAGRA